MLTYRGILHHVSIGTRCNEWEHTLTRGERSLGKLVFPLTCEPQILGGLLGRPRSPFFLSLVSSLAQALCTIADQSIEIVQVQAECYIAAPNGHDNET